MSTYNMYRTMRKLASLGWKHDGTNITNRFADLENERTRQIGAMGGIAGALMTAGAHGKSAPVAKDIPQYDPESCAYIGKSYEVPTSEEDLQKLHKRLLGDEWEDKSPKLFRWMLADRKERIRTALRKALLKSKANVKGMSEGEIASLAFPYILKKDGTVVKNLGLWRAHEYPVKGVFKAEPLY